MLLAFPAFAQNPQGEFDSKPYLALAFSQAPMQTMFLQRMQGHCPQGLRRAILFDRRAPVAWVGCWEAKDGKVLIGFEDGDFMSLDRDRFTWLPETNT
jgi:hypothetical protein